MKIVVGGKGKCSTFAPANDRNVGHEKRGVCGSSLKA